MSIEDPNAPRTGGDGSGGMQQPNLEERAKQDFGKVTETAQHDLEAISERAAEDVAALKDRAGEELGAATDKAKSFANDQKTLAAGQIGGVAAAIDKVAKELDGSDQQTIARYARDLAAGLSRFGRDVESRDVDDLMGMAQDFGRRQPIAFLGAAALAGFMASRFALASAHRREERAMNTGMADGQSTTSYGPSTQPAYGGTTARGEQMGGGDVYRQ